MHAQPYSSLETPKRRVNPLFYMYTKTVISICYTRLNYVKKTSFTATHANLSMWVYPPAQVKNSTYLGWSLFAPLQECTFSQSTSRLAHKSSAEFFFWKRFRKRETPKNRARGSRSSLRAGLPPEPEMRSDGRLRKSKSTSSVLFLQGIVKQEEQANARDV